MLDLDKYGTFLIAAFGITWVVFATYLAYLRSRLRGLQRAAEQRGSAVTPDAATPL
ncbi:MAG: CcmD family protein [Chloroflexi bacterium]|nr:CcmD family protein [Chloroflexota bacterium]